MTLRLRYFGESSVPVEVEGITPDALAGKSLSDIEKREVYQGNRQAKLADFFELSGTADERHEWEGDLRGVHWIGAGMRGGELHVQGDVGRHVGSEMRGGSILVEGNAGDWLGGEMHGGLIHVRGRAGHLPGAAYRGSARGMTSGTILIEGDAGNEIGHTMRRGLIVVGGQAGDLIGFNMLAGTILMLGESGIRPGAGMRRGTIGFFGPRAPDLLPSFRHACRYRPEMLALLLATLRRHAFPYEPALDEMLVELFHGDMIEGGRGEVLVRSVEP